MHRGRFKVLPILRCY